MTLCAKFGSESRSFDSDLVEYLVPLPSVCGVPVRLAPVRAGSIQSSTLPPSAAASRTGSDRCLCSFLSVRRSAAPPFVLLARAGPAEDHRVRRHRSVAGNPGGQSTSSASRSCAESSTPPGRALAFSFVCRALLPLVSSRLCGDLLPIPTSLLLLFASVSSRSQAAAPALPLLNGTLLCCVAVPTSGTCAWDPVAAGAACR